MKASCCKFCQSKSIMAETDCHPAELFDCATYRKNGVWHQSTTCAFRALGNAVLALGNEIQTALEKDGTRVRAWLFAVMDTLVGWWLFWVDLAGSIWYHFILVPWRSAAEFNRQLARLGRWKIWKGYLTRWERFKMAHLLNWFDDRTDICRADLVSWALGSDTFLDDDGSRRSGSPCRLESLEPPICMCWCGKYRNGFQMWGAHGLYGPGDPVPRSERPVRSPWARIPLFWV